MDYKKFSEIRRNVTVVCMTCNSNKVKLGDFRDDLSRKEFRISGMCQKCQDEVFQEPEE